ncbi:hypothetical protein NSZ01_30130 [Nocardioides szechwanensis]|uniref:ABC-2 type transport system ATP-binding protein n=1 Tax=Nocardioides szechwanensis TaxID=1005944 RepID=A0A1H0DUJ2_9ACTN|nr:ATP-binding cassette domain-containing protein [Nocardioides szechwanensis]GEP35245.1 hypothetical protein NSZ01_30130 [Nocardioides szechwanensis]SDN73703.1 ABC-2 type transport system ATP-binding protein [Nocardioides szechwanensis]
MSNHSTAIEVAGMTKSYGDNTVLRGIDLTVPTGTVYALLGPNGAGKTTVVRILSTLMSADGGEARVAGFDVRREPDGVRRSIGVTGQFSAIDELLTGRENLRLMADLAHLPRAAAAARARELLERFGLTDAADRRAATYSGGMKRRLDGGRLVAEGTPAELKSQAGGETLDDVFLALTGHPATPETDENDPELEEIR